MPAMSEVSIHGRGPQAHWGIRTLEITRTKAAFSPQPRPVLFGLIASHGLRLSEVLSLNIGDVDLRLGLRSGARTSPSHTSRRCVPARPRPWRATAPRGTGLAPQVTTTRQSASAPGGAPVWQVDQRQPGRQQLRPTAHSSGLDQPRHALRAAHRRPQAHLRSGVHPAVAAAGHRRGRCDASLSSTLGIRR